MSTSHMVETYCQEDEPDERSEQPITDNPGSGSEQTRIGRPKDDKAWLWVVRI